jgi:hypothetical protein
LAAFAVVPGLLRLLVFASPVLKAWRMQRAGAELDATRRPSRVEPVEPYRSAGSGHDAGPERPGDPLRQLAEARLVVLTAQSLLDDAAARSWWDVFGLSLDRGRAKQSSFGAGVRHLRDAEHRAAAAFDALGRSRGSALPDLDTSALAMETDSLMASENVVPRTELHRHIAEARRHACALLARIEEALSAKRGSNQGPSLSD